MRAAIFVGPKQVVIRDVPLPVVGPEQVRIKVEGCGICGSNIAGWQGMPWSRYPSEPGAMGHEAWGVIDEVGSEVEGLSTGDRVAILSDHAYAEYDVANAHSVLPLPRILEGHPFPGEALGCAFNIFSRSDIKPNQTVAVIGIGFLGALLTKLISDAGARVIAISRRPYSLDLARSMGATRTIAMEDHQAIIREVSEFTGGRFCDRVIEAIGKQWPLDLAGELTREYGKLIIAGYHQDGPRQVNMQMWNWRALDVVNAHERDPQIYLRGMRSAIRAIEDRRLDPTPLYTHRFALEELAHGLNSAESRPEGFLKGWIDPSLRSSS